MYTQEDENDNSPFWETHFIFSQNLLRLQNMSEVGPSVEGAHDGIVWDVETPGVTARGVFDWLWRYYLAPAALLTALTALLDHYGTFAVAADIVWFAICLATLIARQHWPPLRVFFERESSSQHD